MLSEIEVERLKKRIKEYLKERIVFREKEGRFVDFFLNNSRNALDSAKLLFEVSTKQELMQELGLPEFNGFLWVINTSYYSMFYMARALLESGGIKIKTELSIHAVTFDALINYFYLTGRLEKRLIEDFAEAESEAAILLGKEKARALVEDYDFERKKRATFTYEVGLIALQNKAQTSLERAKRFNEEIRKIIEL